VAGARRCLERAQTSFGVMRPRDMGNHVVFEHNINTPTRSLQTWSSRQVARVNSSGRGRRADQWTMAGVAAGGQ